MKNYGRVEKSPLSRPRGKSAFFLEGKGILLLVLSGYLVCALGVIAPVLPVIRTHVVGELGLMQDLEGNLWVQWYVHKALSSGISPFYTALDYYPYGCNLLLLLGNMADAFLSLPFQLLFHRWAYFNVMCMAVIIANALSGYALGRTLLFSPAVSFICGLVGALNPYVLFEISHGRVAQSMIFPMMLYLLCALRFFRGTATRRDLFLAALSFVISCLFYWFYGFFLVMVTFLYLCWLLASKERGVLKKAAALACLSALMLVPVILPYWSAYKHSDSDTGIRFFTDFPPGDSVMNGAFEGNIKYILALSESLRNPFSMTHFSSPPTMVLAIFFLPFAALLFMKGAPRFWGAVFLFFFLISLGPYMKVGDTFYVTALGSPVPLPYLLFYKYLPFFSRLYYPYRMESVMVLSMVIMTGYALSRFMKREGLPLGAKWGIVSLILLLYGGELTLKGYLPVQVSRPCAPAFYSMISREGAIALVNVPIGYCHDAVLYQIYHGKAMLGGPGEFDVMRYPGRYKRFIEENALLCRFFTLEKEHYVPVEELRCDAGKLSLKGFKYVIAHRRFFQAMENPGGKLDYDEAIALLEEVLGPPLASTPGETLFLLPGRPVK
ncbi:MAG: hypothetical protein RDV48_18665 [Candidatus Eremiobacteraeota bacterium]|nr:hypothetical protein [Candidatus Eremiobacteraeota bacterium]